MVVQGEVNNNFTEKKMGDDLGARDVHKHSLSVEKARVQNVESVAFVDHSLEQENMEGSSSSRDHAPSLNTSDLEPSKVFQGEEWQQVSRRKKKGKIGFSRPITRSYKITFQ